MRTEALNRVKLVFTLFDVNGNGYLEADDFELMATHVVQAVPSANDAAKSAMVAAFRTYWTAVVGELDADRDGKISLDEYVACVLSPERFDEAVDEFAESLSALGDLEGDGLVARPTFIALMTAIGFRLPNIHTLFDAFGPTDADRIARATWADGIRDYYDPAKAGIPGDHLVGDPAV
ncbi:EF-hand domain-containing protein [Streptomyces sp. NPDC051662]|uniref:EF-hand domain-containing protein n=1 Tax=Streptomyces sp. NPDC051662 TaxID=3154750 RepID=UPI0034364B14